MDDLVGAGVEPNRALNTTALHVAIQFNRARMVRHLRDRGASVAIEDGTYGSDAAGWAHACDDGGEAAVAIRELLGTNRS